MLSQIDGMQTRAMGFFVVLLFRAGRSERKLWMTRVELGEATIATDDGSHL